MTWYKRNRVFDKTTDNNIVDDLLKQRRFKVDKASAFERDDYCCLCDKSFKHVLGGIFEVYLGKNSEKRDVTFQFCSEECANGYILRNI